MAHDSLAIAPDFVGRGQTFGRIAVADILVGPHDQAPSRCDLKGRPACPVAGEILTAVFGHTIDTVGHSADGAGLSVARGLGPWREIA